VVVIAVVVVPIARGTVDDVAGQHMAMWDVVGVVGETALRLARMVAYVALLIAAADYVYQRKSHAKSMRMTKQEVRDEFKQAEGNQEVKGKIKGLQLAAARNRMLAAVGDANVVVVNPVHIAVALRYEPLRGAPRVVAKGAGAVAERIRDEATRSGVPIVESIPLARALHKACDLDDEIPATLYEGVARLLAFVQRLGGRAPIGGGHHRLAEPVGAAL
jgi:flagellar biosynthetic protein FlhB